MNNKSIKLPELGTKLNSEQLSFLNSFATSCRASILQMTTNAKSGHPGGSLSCVDYLTLLYTFIISQTGSPVVVSNGHISPAVYAVLAELGYIPKDEVVNGFRKIGQPYEGHVTRHVPGVWYGTGPLGAGVSAASGFALAMKMLAGKTSHETPSAPTSSESTPPHRGSEASPLTGKVFALVGDGESQEGQVYEMMNFAMKYELNNLIVFMDYNEVQLTDSLEKVMPFDPKSIFLAGGWEVIGVDGHDFVDMWKVLDQAMKVKDKPVLLLGHTIMGKGVDFMEETGERYEATWHGKAGSLEQIEPVLKDLELTSDQRLVIDDFVKNNVQWRPEKPRFEEVGNKMEVQTGEPIEYPADKLTDCRSAYGNALLDLAKLNENVVALTADLAGSVKTAVMGKEFPERHIECGVAEQQMVSCSGGLSLSGMIPFCSTFGAFMSSRAKDQARVNDINHANVKMVATHCGLSVGEDGPTHQAIDDSGSFLGMFNTMQMEPADPNHCDRIIRYAAGHYGNCYVRMGRHKIPVLTREDGSIFFDKDYEYYYGRCDVLREGDDVTIVASGGVVAEALQAVEVLKEKNVSAELVIASSIKKFDETLINSIDKTKKVVTVEDHNTLSGLGGQLSRHLFQNNVEVEKFEMIGVEGYQLSGTWEDLYKAAGIDSGAIVERVESIV